MNRVYLKYLGFFTAIVVCLWLYQKQQYNPETYIIAVDFVPEKVKPHRIRTTTEYYIALQMYFPLISVDKHNEIQSHFLDLSKTKALNSDFNSYFFCLKKDLKFSDDSNIDIEHVVQTIRRLEEIAKNLNRVEVSSDDKSCALIKLNSSDPFFMHKFTRINSTPIKSIDSNFPIGLGAYKFSRADESEIELKQTSITSSNQFKKIKFILKNNVKEVPEGYFIDRNHLANQKESQGTSFGMTYSKRPSQKPYALIVNYESSALTKEFAKCFPREEYAALQEMPLSPLPGFLPKGIMGFEVQWSDAISSVKSTDCSPKDVTPLTILHYTKSNLNQVEEFFNKHRSRLPIPIIFKHVDIKQFIEDMYSKNNLAGLVGFETEGFDTYRQIEIMQFFSSFIDKDRNKRIVSNLDKKLLQLYENAFGGLNDSSFKEGVEAVHRELMTSGQVVPLGELERTSEYPIELKNINWLGRGSGISGYPDISKMTWQPSIVGRFFH